ncbi:MAG: DUF4363 family protein [Oscillospiraceae bacterium]|nr:DUF4363 family protein [Oscillospiraceae bacterium]
MSRFLTSVAILIALTVLSVVSLRMIRHECREYTSLTEEINAAFSAGDTQAALAGYDKLEEGWDHFHHVTRLFVDGSKLDAIYSHITPLRPLLEQGDPYVYAELESIRLLTEGLYEEELPVFWHIL